MHTETTERRVWVTTRHASFHNWPDAPEERDYLRSTHRHLFGVRLELIVGHNERQVEFHDLLDWLNTVAPYVIDHGGSCETMAEGIAHAACDFYDVPAVCSVDEDGESGATVTVHENPLF